MELILISNSKLKIMLDEEDMREYRIGEDSDCAEPDTRKALRHLLDRARDEVGFNTDGSEIFVQLYTSKRGGCELFITKSKLSEPLTRKEGQSSRAKGIGSCTDDKKTHRREPATKHKDNEISVSLLPEAKESAKLPAMTQGGRMAFSFADLESLLTVCDILTRADLNGESRAYCDDDGYYLLLCDTGTSAFSRLDKLTFISEYGRRENPDCLLTYMSEHGKTICGESAVETLARFKA